MWTDTDIDAAYGYVLGHDVDEGLGKTARGLVCAAVRATLRVHGLLRAVLRELGDNSDVAAAHETAMRDERVWDPPTLRTMCIDLATYGYAMQPYTVCGRNAGFCVYPDESEPRVQLFGVHEFGDELFKAGSVGKETMRAYVDVTVAGLTFRH